MGIQERRERERERRKQQIMVAAKRVFTDKGFGKATMEDIAKEAELSPGTLYLYFKNKDELYASLSLRILQYLTIRLEHVNAEPYSDASQRLNALKDAMFDVYEFDPLILINMFHMQSSETIKNLSPDLLEQIETLSRNSMQVIADIFEDGIRKNQFVDRHPSEVADILWSLFSGIVLWETSKKIINGNQDVLKETFDTAFEIFSRGIMRHQPAH
jgi:AcrR family transcriptional regulator